MEDTKKAGFICVKDTLDGAYPSLVLAVNAARQGMERVVFFLFWACRPVIVAVCL